MALPLIKVVQLTVTNRCQCNCKHCGVSKLRETVKGELTLEQIDLLFQDLRLAGCLVVDLFGGEPTLRADLCEIIGRGRSYGFIMSLETNGYVVDEAYMNRLAAAGLNQIYLSLDDCRAEVHDEIRRKAGSFDRAVRALELGAKTGIVMHVSTVPQTRDFFLSGDVNRFMQFVLDHGAEKVRLLLPRFVGDSIREEGGPVCSGEEKELFSHVAPAYRDYIYLHTPGTPLGEKNICTAKQVFCHVMSNGWVAPCPYFPLVFGDALREPIIDVFERIQGHPLVRLGGDYCPMRDEEYIDAHIRKLGLDRPFFPITVGNQIDLGAPCGAGCPDCNYGKRPIPRPADEILREIGEMDPAYARIEFYGGDAFLRDDLFVLLDRMPSGMRATLWTACSGELENKSLGDRARSSAIEAINVHFPAGRAETATNPHAMEEAFRNVASLRSWGLPVRLWAPMYLLSKCHQFFAARIHELGVERLYAYAKDTDLPLVNSVACFGRVLGRARILWVDDNSRVAG